MSRPVSRSLLALVADKPVVLCLGSGGVGKTTTAAALAIALAKQGERVVVLTIDPAKRLADALGQSGSLSNEPSQVEIEADGELWAAMLDPGETFEAIIRAEAPNSDQADRILSNPLFDNLTESLSGTNEYMATERLHQLHNDERFDRVIIDTPPSRHVMDFLDSPGRLIRFIDHRLYRSVLAPKHRLLKSLNAGTQLVMRLLTRLVGANLVDDVMTFFSDFEGLDDGFRRRASEIEELLTSTDTGYVLITAPRTDPLQEAEWILGNLERRARNLDAIVVNRVLPIAPDKTKSGSRAGSRSSKGPLEQNLAELAALANQEKDLIDQLATAATAPLLQLPEQTRPVRELDDLQTIAGLL